VDIVHGNNIQLHSFRSGMGYLTSSLAARLPVRSGASVETVKLTSDGIRIIGQGFVESVDGLIIATALPETVRLLERYLSRDVQNVAAAWTIS
jgi:protoporphyrinogen oxidase